MTNIGTSTIWTGRKAAPKTNWQPHYAVGQPQTLITSITRNTRGWTATATHDGREMTVALYKEDMAALAHAADFTPPSYTGSTLILDSAIDVVVQRYDDSRKQHIGLRAIHDPKNGGYPKRVEWLRRAKSAAEPIETAEQPSDIATVTASVADYEAKLQVWLDKQAAIKALEAMPPRRVVRVTRLWADSPLLIKFEDGEQLYYDGSEPPKRNDMWSPRGGVEVEQC